MNSMFLSAFSIMLKSCGIPIIATFSKVRKNVIANMAMKAFSVPLRQGSSSSDSPELKRLFSCYQDLLLTRGDSHS